MTYGVKEHIAYQIKYIKTKWQTIIICTIILIRNLDTIFTDSHSPQSNLYTNVCNLLYHENYRILQR